MKANLCPIVLFLTLNLHAALAQLPAYKHDHLNIYPATVKVDGDLSDWKSEMFVEMYADPDLKEFFSLRLAFAYDARGLYVAAHFIDRSPLINHTDPRVDPFKGWSGDALQIRFITDPATTQPLPTDKLKSNAITHLTMWYFTDAKMPVLDIRHGMDFHGQNTLTGDKAGMVYLPVADGYTLEGCIPWSVLGVPGAPTAGQRWIMTLQPLWGDASGNLQHNFYDVIRAAGFQFQSPDGWGHGYFVKPDEVAAKFAEQAAEDRRIFADAQETKPRAGIPVKYTNPAKGFVSLAICKSDGQIVRTLLTKAERGAGAQAESWDGLDDDGKPVPPGDYLIKALVHPGIKPRYVCSVMNSGNPGWGNGGGHYGWGADHGVPVGAASDPDGNTYLEWNMNEGGDYLIQVDATGQKHWGARISWGDFNGGATAVLYDEGLVYTAKDGPSSGTNSLGGLFVYQAKTGNRVTFANGASTLAVTQWPSQLAAGHSEANLLGLAATTNRLLCSLHWENKIVALDKKTYERRETYAVPHPRGLAYDASHKLLYAISDDTIVTIGADGAVKPFATGLDEPFGLALDADGNLFVSVRGKQMQVWVFDPRGKKLREIGKRGGRPSVGRFDPHGMYMPAGISVDTRGQLWVTEEDATPKRQSVWDAKRGRFIKDFFGAAAYAVMMAPDPEIPEHVYLHNTRFIVNYDKGTWYPDATIYRQTSTNMPPGSEAGYGFMGGTFEVASFQGKKFAFNAHGSVFAYGRDQFKPLLTRPGANNIAQFGGSFFPGAGFIQGYRIYRPTGLTKEGVPIYPEPKDAPPVLDGKGPMTAYPNWNDVWPSFQSHWKEFYACSSLPNPVNGGLDGGGEDGIYRFTRNGDIRWRYRRVAVFYALKAPLAKTGDLYGALRIAGEAELPKKNGGEIVGIGCYRGYFGFLNEDGLFIDQVGYDNGRGPTPSFDTFFIENFSGYFFKHPRTGKVYLFCGDVDGRILELQGWDKIQRFDGKFTLTDAQYQTALAAGSGPSSAAGKTTLVISAGKPQEKTFGRIELDETHGAQAGLGYDTTNLYATFIVADASPWQNSSTDWHYVFKGGDAVDIQLGARQSGPEKRTPQPGDVRVFVAPTGTVAMWLRVPPGMKTEPQRYQSPTGEESFERVALLTNVVSKVEKQSNGYRVDVTIPWNALGMTPPAAHSQFQGDVGVLLSDASGARTTLRRYLFNQDTGIVNDIPNEVRVNTANWGRLSFE